MPRALPINWNEVRAVVIASDYRTAAGAFGINEASIRKRASRERWFAHPAVKEVMKKKEAVTQVVTDCGTPTAATAIAEHLLALNKRTRLALAKALCSAAETAAEMEGGDALAHAEKLGHVTRGASTVHEWREHGATTAISTVVLPSPEAIMMAMRELNAHNL